MCDSILNIPLSKNNISLNLSHAVLLVSFKFTEIITNKDFIINSDKIDNNLASKKDFIYFMNFLKNELHNSNFLYSRNKNESNEGDERNTVKDL